MTADSDPRPDERVAIHGEADIIAARQTARRLARTLGFGVVDQSRIATAVSELARNVVRYATGRQGRMTARQIATPTGRVGLEIVVADDGPGIADLEAAMRPGATTSGGLGLGLPGTRRLMDEMTIDSAPGRGTTITLIKWRR